MKLTALNIKKLRKKSISAIRNILKGYNVNYSISEDKEKLLHRLDEIQYFSRKVKIYQRYEVQN